MPVLKFQNAFCSEAKVLCMILTLSTTVHDSHTCCGGDIVHAYIIVKKPTKIVGFSVKDAFGANGRREKGRFRIQNLSDI